jgi:short subunit dehydrogenase-like uncharacterized protein
MLAHESAAKASGARLIFCCGFDSIPFDLGVHFLQDAMVKTFGAPASRVRGRIRRLYPGIRGGMSGGSIATIRTLFVSLQENPEQLQLLHDPFALTPGFTGPPQPDGNVPYEDHVAGSWVGPFIMATINTKIMHRSNLLLDHAWGKDFRYDEMVILDGPPASDAAPPNPFADPNLPQPGHGPSKSDREGGSYDILFIGESQGGQSLRASVKSDFDASADSTSRLLAESAICLAKDISHDKVGGGIWTPAAAMGNALIDRLTANAGMGFSIEA